MTIVFYMNCVSAHQLPLAKEVAELVGPERFRYIDAGEKSESAQTVDVSRFQGFKVSRLDEGREWLETADLVLTGMRDLALFERRAKKGLRTYYTSERWFKPVHIVRMFGLFECSIGGWVRMSVPGYRRMVKRFVKWANEDPGARVFAIGPWARRDFIRLGIRPEKLIPWGYFVAPSTSKRLNIQTSKHLNILWVGRMLALKRVDTIIRAVKKVEKVGVGVQRKVSLTIVGDGPEKGRLQRMARSYTSGKDSASPFEIEFLPSQPMEKVRELMREHDLFVFPSNGYEGWGAVVSEALEEGMRVLGTFEAGASATLLPRERLFHSGDWKGLARLIEKEMRGELPPCSIGEWTAKAAANRCLGV